MSDSDSESSSSSSDDAAARFLPKSQKGWGGGDLEMEHQRESFREQKKGAAAVDISQFQNTEVGKGYQAKHVVRQKGHSASQEPKSVRIKDMSTSSSIAGTKRKEADLEEDAKVPKKDTPKTRLNKYIECPGMRNFRREIEEILLSS